MKFADWLCAELDSQDVTFRELARRLGVAPTSITRWTGDSVPSVKYCLAIGRALGVDPMRVVVTAGHLGPHEAGVEAFKVDPTLTKLKLLGEALEGIRPLSDEERDAIWRAAKKILETGVAQSVRSV